MRAPTPAPVPLPCSVPTKPMATHASNYAPRKHETMASRAAAACGTGNFGTTAGMWESRASTRRNQGITHLAGSLHGTLGSSNDKYGILPFARRDNAGPGCCCDVLDHRALRPNDQTDPFYANGDIDRGVVLGRLPRAQRRLVQPCLYASLRGLHTCFVCACASKFAPA